MTRCFSVILETDLEPGGGRTPARTATLKRGDTIRGRSICGMTHTSGGWEPRMRGGG